MSDATAIEWTDATFNPWWGCTKVGPGCDHCYAETLAGRFGTQWGVGAKRREFGDKHWNDPVRWNKAAQKAGKRRRVFCASMADVFDNDAPAGVRERLWALIESTPWLDWQLLTKRIGNVAKMVPPAWMASGFPSNIWIGATVVNQAEADRDVPKLLQIPAAIRFLSIEPMLGPVDLRAVKFGHMMAISKLDWIICGGESGHKARTMHPDWARALRDQCAAAGVPFLFKQWGEWVSVSEVAGDGPHHRFQDGATVRRAGKKAAGRKLDGVEHNGFPVTDIDRAAASAIIPLADRYP